MQPSPEWATSNAGRTNERTNATITDIIVERSHRRYFAPSGHIVTGG
jgi:hypothetical protein